MLEMENDIKIQKYIAECGLMSRRAAEREIAAGLVKINGEVAEIGQRVRPTKDRVEYKGAVVAKKRGTHNTYLMLNKPTGYLTTMSDDKGRKTVAELITGVERRVYPVGRLDMDSEGLLLFTNDGDFANALMHPKHEVKKTYLVWTTGYVPGAEVRLGRSIELDGYTIRPPQVKLLKAEGQKARFQVTIHEGRNRQVRRMCEAAGMTCTRLRRIREGNLSLGELPVGKWRYLTEEEVKALR